MMVRVKSIAIDKRRAPFIIEAFEMYARGGSRLVDIADFLASKGIKTGGNKPLSKDQVKHMLKNPFYYGHFYYGGEVHEGKHKAIIDKKLFDRVQVVLARRGYNPHKTRNEPQALCGLLACGVCNMSITAEKKVKHQKNGNIHEYVYYRCTRKSKTIACKESPITEPVLLVQLTDILQGYALPKSWADALMTMLEEDEKQAEQSSGVLIADAQSKVGNLQGKLQRLLDGYLDQDIDQPTYKAKQAELMSDKKSLEEQTGKLTLAANAWVEPMRQWLKQAHDFNRIAKSAEPSAIKQAFAEIDGLNLFLENKKARLRPRPISALPPPNCWQALCAAREKIAHAGENLSENTVLVRFYAEIRTDFRENG